MTISTVGNSEKLMGDFSLQSNRIAGMTFIEIIAVMLIIGFIASSGALAVYFGSLERARIDSGCRRLASFITEAQAQSVLGSKEMILVYNMEEEKHFYYFMEPDDEVPLEERDVKYLPNGVYITEIYTNDFEFENSGELKVYFRKDGAVTPHLVHLSTDPLEADPLQYTIRVAPLTGYVKIYKGILEWEELME